MKIGVDIRVLMDRNYSGVSNYTANLLSAILAADKQNEYRLFYNSFHNLSQRLSIWKKDNAKLFPRRWPNKIFNYFNQFLLSRPKLDRACGGVDIFWSPHFNLTRLSPKAKSLLTVHDLSFWRQPGFFSFRKNFWHRTLCVSRLMRRADLIVAVSENTKRDICELAKISAEKVRVIYPGNNLEPRIIPQAEVETFFRSKNLADWQSCPIILYLGNIEPRKNLVNLIAAFSRLRQDHPELGKAKLILAGAPGWKTGQIYRAAKASPFSADIRFLGYVSPAEQQILYSSARLFAYPSLYEGFGFPPLEAMSFGLPVVTSFVSSLPEVVGDAAILINPHKPEEIAEALCQGLSDVHLRESLSQRGLSRAARFSWHKAAQEYLEIFAELNGKN